MTYDKGNGTVDAPVSIPRLVGLIIAIIVVAGVMVPVCDAAGHDRVSEDNEGTGMSLIRAGMSGTLDASAVTDGGYVLIGETLTVKSVSGELEVLAMGGGTDVIGEAGHYEYDGTTLTIGTHHYRCAWAFRYDPQGGYRYGGDAMVSDKDDVYGVGTAGGAFFSVNGDTVKIGGVL